VALENISTIMGRGSIKSALRPGGMQIKKRADIDKTVKLYEDIRASFPHLQMELQLEHPHVDLNMEISRQPRMLFQMNLNLQGDELHLQAGSFWLEWFPCTDPEIVGFYRDAVTGLLSGRYRIVEQHVGSLAVMAQLQCPHGDGWQTLGTWSNFGVLIPWRKTTRVLQNVP
jgi:hypothetical protein